MGQRHLIPYTEYFQQENGLMLSKEKFSKFYPGFIEDEIYKKIHALTPVLCHDAILNYNGKALVAYRDGRPAKGVLSPLGGALKKGSSLEDSLRKKIRQESGLEIDALKQLGITRVVWEDDPFDHGKGTDSFVFMYYGIGKGDLKLESLSNPLLISPKEYTNEFRNSLHPYTRDFLDVVIDIMSENKTH